MTATPSGRTITTTATLYQTVFDGLDPGTTYRFAINAINANASSSPVVVTALTTTQTTTSTSTTTTKTTTTTSTTTTSRTTTTTTQPTATTTSSSTSTTLPTSSTTTSTTSTTTTTTASTTSTTAPTYTLFLPQVADGRGFSTKFTLFGTPGTTPIAGRLKSYKPDGAARSLQISGIINSEFSVSIPAGASLRLTTSGAGATASSGWAVFETGTPVQGLATFDLRDPNGNLTTTVAVLGSAAAKKVILPVETSASANTGVAIVNNGFASVIVRSRWIDEGGVEVANILHPRLNPLGGKMQVSAFASEFLGSISGTTPFNGTLILEVVGEGQISVTGLVLREGLLSAIPVVIIE